MATLNENYKLLYKTMKEQGCKAEPLDTLVWLVRYHKMTSLEHQQITIHIRNHRPTKDRYKEFYNFETFSKNPKGQYWWSKYNDATRRQMRLFIRKMIRLTRDE